MFKYDKICQNKKFEVTTNEAVEITGYESQHLNRLAKQGIISKNSYGKWHLVDLFKKLNDYKIKLATEPLLEQLKQYQSNDPEYRFKRVRADREERNFLLENNIYIYRKDFEDILAKLAQLLKTTLESLPIKCKNKFKYVSDDIEREKIIIELITKLLIDITNIDMNRILPNELNFPQKIDIENNKRQNHGRNEHKKTNR